MAPPPIWVWTCAALLLMAGCSGQNDSATTDVCTACPGDAALSGIVLDDEERPVANASVQLGTDGAQILTDADGRFRIEGIAPGEYQLFVVRLGFEAYHAPVTVEPGAPRELVIQLVPIRVEVPYYDVIGPMAGMFSCGVGTPVRIAMCHTYASAAFADDQPRMPFQMTAAHWESFVGEMRWTSGTAATSTHLANYMTYEGDTGGLHWWCAADGPSPIVFRYERTLPSTCSDQGVTNPLPDLNMTLVVAADVGFGGTDLQNPPARVAVEQRFHLMMSIFYGEPAPEEWTALPDT